VYDQRFCTIAKYKLKYEKPKTADMESFALNKAFGVVLTVPITENLNEPRKRQRKQLIGTIF